MNSFEKIQSVLSEVANGSNFALSVPEEMSHGDYATNIAFIMSKQPACAGMEKISPKEFAEKIISILTEKLSDTVSKIEVAGAGFINFYLKDEIIREENNKDLSAQAGIKNIETKYTGQNILVEHSSPNLFKPFSIGHLMNNFVGEFIVRATKIGGGNVRSMSFPSDVSLGIAKALYIIEKDKKDLSFFENTNEDEVIKYLGDAYVRGVKECEENEDSLNEAKKVLDRMYSHSNEDADFINLIKITRKINENYFKRILNEIGTQIDNFVYESQAGEVGDEIVKENIGKVFTESEGAVVYVPSEDRKDINTSVFINSQGYPTYEAKDLGLMKIKFEKLDNFHPEFSLFVTDSEQSQHFKVVFDAAEKLGDDWKEWIAKSKHVPHGRMTFKGQKMSSRLGGVPLALDVIETVCEEVRERSGEKTAQLSEEEKNKLEKDIALSALRIAVLRSKPGLNINFDPETSLSFEGDSGPYLMYTHARCFSLLEKGNTVPKFHDFPKSELEWKLHSFELVLKESTEELAPQKLVTYLFSLAQEFNSFYGSTQIISDDKEKTQHNLAVVNCVKNVLKTGLYVLGITAPNKM